MIFVALCSLPYGGKGKTSYKTVQTDVLPLVLTNTPSDTNESVTLQVLPRPSPNVSVSISNAFSRLRPILSFAQVLSRKQIETILSDLQEKTECLPNRHHLSAKYRRLPSCDFFSTSCQWRCALRRTHLPGLQQMHCLHYESKFKLILHTCAVTNLKNCFVSPPVYRSHLCIEILKEYDGWKTNIYSTKHFRIPAMKCAKKNPRDIYFKVEILILPRAYIHML